MNNITDKYKQMISAFAADFSLAEDYGMGLSNLQELVNKKDKRLLMDIHLLQELEFRLRNGEVKIVEAPYEEEEYEKI